VVVVRRNLPFVIINYSDLVSNTHPSWAWHLRYSEVRVTLIKPNEAQIRISPSQR